MIESSRKRKRGTKFLDREERYENHHAGRPTAPRNFRETNTNTNKTQWNDTSSKKTIENGRRHTLSTSARERSWISLRSSETVWGSCWCSMRNRMQSNARLREFGKAKARSMKIRRELCAIITEFMEGSECSKNEWIDSRRRGAIRSKSWTIILAEDDGALLPIDDGSRASNGAREGDEAENDNDCERALSRSAWRSARPHCSRAWRRTDKERTKKREVKWDWRSSRRRREVTEEEIRKKETRTSAKSTMREKEGRGKREGEKERMKVERQWSSQCSDESKIQVGKESDLEARRKGKEKKCKKEGRKGKD